MFGAFRLLLSLMVVWYHLIDWRFAGPVAVFGFYVVSGYLMTKVINEVYSDGLAGFGRYIANRALRIYPMYWVALALSAAVVVIYPDIIGVVSKNYGRDGGLVTDLVIFGHWAYTPSLLPQAWSLAVELVYYLAMGALLSRWRWVTVAWFLFGLEIVLFAAIKGGIPFRWFFTSLAASSLPFACGAMIYHFGGRLPRMPAAVAAISVAAIVVSGLLMPRAFGLAGGIYVGLGLAVTAAATLSRMAPHRIDTALGDLAYPVFLFHYPAGAIVMRTTEERGLLTGILALALTLALSVVAIAIAERPLRSIRSRLRRRTARASPQVQ